MVQVNNLTLAFGKRTLFKEVNIKFLPGNCYGLIGANGSGKSTFLKVLSGEIEPSSGTVNTGKNERIAILRQDQFAYDDYKVLETVIMGHEKLHAVMKEREIIYSKGEFTEEDGNRAGELEEIFGHMNGYEAEADAATLLAGLGIPDALHGMKMKDLEGSQKVRVLLAQTLFGNPDTLLLDEPTNQLDIESITWLENFILNFNNTVIVVSHDRHFINKVCTHIADIDYGQIKVYTGNYDFWVQASQLDVQQKKDENEKKEEQAKQLQEFIARFSANASKAKQATSRKKLLEKLTLDEIPPSSRRFPYVSFKPNRDCGTKILTVEGLTLEIDGQKVMENYDFQVHPGDKIAFFGQNANAKTAFFQAIVEEVKPAAGKIKWGETITIAYFPKENSKYFEDDVSLYVWLRQYSKEKDDTAVRGFLGRMLFSGDEALKSVTKLSGGERVRLMLSKMMQTGANALVLDEPTNHLDLESITALNNALMAFPGVLLFSSHDHQFIETIANRVIEITPGGVIDRAMTFDEYMESKDVQALRDKLYHGHQRLML